MLDECQRPADSYDLLGGLFVEMNTPGKTPGGRYKGVAYFNGGLFAEPARIELDDDELQLLRVMTIVQPWHDAIEDAKTRQQLRELLARLQHFTVLDPACGSGNFLYLAYREMKRLEARLIERLNESPSSKADEKQMSLGFVTARQFYGLDISPFAVELANTDRRKYLRVISLGSSRGAVTAT